MTREQVKFVLTCLPILLIMGWLLIGCAKCVRSHEEQWFIPQHVEDDCTDFTVGDISFPICTDHLVPAHYESRIVCDEYESKTNDHRFIHP